MHRGLFDSESAIFPLKLALVIILGIFGVHMNSLSGIWNQDLNPAIVQEHLPELNRWQVYSGYSAEVIELEDRGCGSLWRMKIEKQQNNS